MAVPNGLNPEFEGSVKAASTTAYTTSGGATAVGVMLSSLDASTCGLGIFFGAGAPLIPATKGSLYLRTNGTTSTATLYVNTSGSTTWLGVGAFN